MDDKESNLPIDEIIGYSGNRFLVTRAIMKRAREINFIGDEDLINYNNRIAMLSLNQILKGEVKFVLSEDRELEEK